jgi:hypothetical protein
MSTIAIPVPKATARRRVAGFWMSTPTTLAYQVEDDRGDRITMEVEFASAAEAKTRCAEAIRAVTEAVRSEGLLPNTKASYLSATADLIADWIIARMQKAVSAHF